MISRLIKMKIALAVFSVLITVCSLCACSSSGSGDASSSSQTPTVAAPVFTIPDGTYTIDQSIAITCATPDATIHYTTDGSLPTAGSAVYTGPITVVGNGTTMTIKAVAAKAGFTDSPVVSATYTIVYHRPSPHRHSPPLGEPIVAINR